MKHVLDYQAAPPPAQERPCTEWGRFSRELYWAARCICIYCRDYVLDFTRRWRGKSLNCEVEMEFDEPNIPGYRVKARAHIKCHNDFTRRVREQARNDDLIATLFDIAGASAPQGK